MKLEENGYIMSNYEETGSGRQAQYKKEIGMGIEEYRKLSRRKNSEGLFEGSKLGGKLYTHKNDWKPMFKKMVKVFHPDLPEGDAGIMNMLNEMNEHFKAAEEADRFNESQKKVFQKNFTEPFEKWLKEKDYVIQEYKHKII